VIRKQRFTTGEDIYGSVSMLRPGMNGQMGFRNHDDTADAEGAEMMEVGTDDGGLGDLGTGN
jgi:hypothetical protein